MENKTPQGDVFVWKRLVWNARSVVSTDTGNNLGWLQSPYRNVAWETKQLSAHASPAVMKHAGIFGYWTPVEACINENIERRASALVRCRIWGQVAFAERGARAHHAEMVAIAASADCHEDIGVRYPGVPVRHLRVPLEYSFPEFREDTAHTVLAKMGFTMPRNALEPTDPFARPPRSPAISPNPTALANVRYGIYANPGPFVGLTIAEMRQHLGGLWGVPNDAVAFKGRQKLDNTYVVQKNENIEFHRKEIKPAPRAYNPVRLLKRDSSGHYGSTFAIDAHSMQLGGLTVLQVLPVIQSYAPSWDLSVIFTYQVQRDGVTVMVNGNYILQFGETLILTIPE